MKALYIFFFGLCGICTSYAQTVIDGYVTDATTGEPLVGANVSIDGTMKGASTDEKGYFMINVYPIPAVLTISYIGYKSEQMTVVDFERKKVALSPYNEQLPEIVVSEIRPIEPVFERDFSVLDYVFYQDYIVLLVYRNFFKKHSLILTTEDGEIITETGVKSYHPERLFRGCLGGVHLISAGFARQIYIENERIEFLNKVDKLTFLAKLEPCVTANANYVFYKKAFRKGQIVEYISIDKRNPKVVQRIANVVNMRTLEMLEDEASFQELRQMVAREHNANQPYAGSSLADAGEGTFTNSILYKPIYVPLFEHQDTAYLFDHVHHRIAKINMLGTMVGGVDIEYHKDKKWRKEIVFDEVTGSAYALFDTRWQIELRKIDLATGKVGEALILDRPHISNIQIKDGYLYFLYYAPQHGVDYRKLERMKL